MIAGKGEVNESNVSYGKQLERCHKMSSALNNCVGK